MIVSTTPKQIVFNNYKTSKTYGQQDFTIDDKELNEIINEYIISKGLKNGDYLFHLERNKKEVILQSNFSKLVSDVFFKIYNTPISIRFLRISWISDLMKTNPREFEKERLADYMAHSKEEQSKYNKIKK